MMSAVLDDNNRHAEQMRTFVKQNKFPFNHIVLPNIMMSLVRPATLPQQVQANIEKQLQNKHSKPELLYNITQE